jgi:hypothetical protein
MHGHHAGPLERTVLIGLIAFLTVVDLFGTQAILPALARSYGVTPAAMGFAVNATTMGMAAACLAVAYYSHRIDRRRGVLVSLTLLAIPTAFLAVAPNLATFTVLRVAQGLCMASAVTLTLAYLGEHCSAMDAGGAFAAYITGNVASNLFGRLLAAGLADYLGLPATFLSLAVLNLLGAVIVYVWLTQSLMMMAQGEPGRAVLDLGRAPASPAPATQLRDRLLHPVRLYRHFHLRELRTGPRANRDRSDVARTRLLRLRTFDRHHPVGRSRGTTIRNPAHFLGITGRGGDRPAAPRRAEALHNPDWSDACGHRHLLCPGDGNRLRQPCGHDGSGFSERALSRVLLLGWAGWQRIVGSGL